MEYNSRVGRPQVGVEVLPQGLHRHQFQDDVAKHAGPVLLQPLAVRRGQDRLIRVKQAGLSGVHNPLHNGSKSLGDNELQYKPRSRPVNTKST